MPYGVSIFKNCSRMNETFMTANTCNLPCVVAATVNVFVNNAGAFTLVDVVLSQTVDKKLVQ